MPFDADVLVVGGGPVGCVTALAFARRGARVMVLDPAPDARERFAGELLHPTAMAALKQVGIDGLGCATAHPAVQGYAVFSPETPDPIQLDYGGSPGATFVFDRFVTELRAHMAAHPLIAWMPKCRVSSIDGQTVTWEDRRGAERITRSAIVPLIVGAFGKHGRLGATTTSTKEPISKMAGLLLNDVDLPFEGYGHVVLSRVGPALVYRVSADQVRVCLDVPTPWQRATRRSKLIWEAYRDVLPEALKTPVRDALLDGQVSWAVNSVLPRQDYGRPGFARVGDAVGHFHPMTAVGMTLGFGDALELARCDSLEDYARVRRRDTESPGLLATALYEIFSLDSEPTAACRQAIFQMWTQDPALRARTMGFLSCAETRMTALAAVGVRLVALASSKVAVQRTAGREFRGSLSAIQRIAGLVSWLALESVPEDMQIPFITKAATPFAHLRHQQLNLLTAEMLKLEAT